MATQLDMAEQQLYGWHAAEHGERLVSLVKAMGLSAKEWEKLKDSGTVEYLTDGERKEIDGIFNGAREREEVCSVCDDDGLYCNYCGCSALGT